jgi:hypothetical protein
MKGIWGDCNAIWAPLTHQCDYYYYSKFQQPNMKDDLFTHLSSELCEYEVRFKFHWVDGVKGVLEVVNQFDKFMF